MTSDTKALGRAADGGAAIVHGRGNAVDIEAMARSVLATLAADFAADLNPDRRLA